MFKINKCIRLNRGLPPISKGRYLCFNDKCSPRYECKQPEPDEIGEKIEKLRRASIPAILIPYCSHHAKMWRNIFFFVCVPAVLCCFINFYFLGEEHTKRPKFIEFSHMRIRNKEFPWDKTRTLFHNPRMNALPSGYEVEVPEEEEIDPFELLKR